jgi:hypothetical protein
MNTFQRGHWAVERSPEDGQWVLIGGLAPDYPKEALAPVAVLGALDELKALHDSNYKLLGEFAKKADAYQTENDERFEALKKRIDSLVAGFVFDELHDVRERLAALEARVAGLEEHRQSAFVQSAKDTKKGTKARRKAR